MRRIDKFIEEISFISNRLNCLESEFIESYKGFNGDEFEGQVMCASEIENLTLMMTHELSSQIGFGIHHLKMLLKYIDFRKKYNTYTDEESLNIIDKSSNLNIKQKKEITVGMKEENINKIISEWNATFENNSYNKLTEKLRLKRPTTMHKSNAGGCENLKRNTITKQRSWWKRLWS